MKNMRLMFALVVTLVLIGMPQVMLAQGVGGATGAAGGGTNSGGGGTNTGGGGQNPGVGGGGGVSGSGALTNPLQSDSITEFILKIIDILLVFAIPIIVLFIMYAGFKYVTAAGDPGKVKDATSALTWSVIGGVIILGAKLIIDVIQGTIGSL